MASSNWNQGSGSNVRQNNQKIELRLNSIGQIVNEISNDIKSLSISQERYSKVENGQADGIGRTGYQQMEGQKKPPEILDKIATGKLKQFYEVTCLLDQPHVRDASGKTRVQNLIDELAKKEETKIKVLRFERFRIGG